MPSRSWIHIAKKTPKFQLVAQHYCAPRSNEMHQCLLYDSCEKNARLLGVEYIISDRSFRELPDIEKRYWHPHTYEVLAGGLIAPSIKPAAAKRWTFAAFRVFSMLPFSEIQV